MPHPTGPTDENLRKAVVRLRRTKEKALIDVARRLMMGRRSKKPVNVSRLEKAGKKESTLIVPGKVLGTGSISKPVKVYAWSYSKEAREKIKRAGGQALSMNELAKDKAKGRIVK